MNETLKIYGIYSLVIVYVLINIYYKKLFNLVIFTGIFVIALNIFNNIEKAIILAYILSIVWGIIKNFHLLENFEQSNNKNPNVNMNNTEYKIETDKTIKSLNNIKQKQTIVKNKNSYKNTKINDTIDDGMSSLLSEGLIIKYMEKLRTENINMILTKRVNLMNLKPVLPNLASGKIKLMKNLKH